MSRLTLVYIAKGAPDLGTFDRTNCSGVDLVGLVNTVGISLSALGNEMLSRGETPVFGLCHADAVFGPGALDAFTAEAMAGNVCGIVGRDMQEVYRCAWLDSRDSWWSEGVLTGGPGPVSTLDGMAVFFRKDTWLRFDAETFDGMHCHVEDLCLQAQARGIPVVVPHADAHHRNHQPTAAWLNDYRHYRARLAEKWKGTEFKTT